MKITINTLGSRGDVQPYIALGLGLQRAGHAVRINTHQLFEDFIRSYGLDFYPLPLDPRQVMIQQIVVEIGNNPLSMMRWMQREVRPMLHELFDVTLAANQGTELMLNSGLSFAGWHVAEKLGAPALAAYLQPVTPSRYLVSSIGKIPPPWLPFKGLVNYASGRLSNQLFFTLMLPLINEGRQGLGLRPMTRRQYWPIDAPRYPAPLLYGYSPSVVPKPPDWSEYQQISGYWFLEAGQDYQPDPGLLDFLASGPPPVYVGFGSMIDHERQVVRRMVVEALQQIGQRGILFGGWSELGAADLPDSIYLLEAAPHDWLFPRMAAVVHHGGAGTTAAGLRAGVPGVIVPWFGDQFFWGWRVDKIGAGPKPIPRKQLSAARLAEAIRRAVGDEPMRRRAAEVGEKIRAEDGVGRAVELIEIFARKGSF